MSEERNNSTLLMIKEKFNQISKKFLGLDICDLKTAIDTNAVGKEMIESFRFNNWLKFIYNIYIIIFIQTINI